MGDALNPDCTCPVPPIQHTTGIDTSVSVSDLQWLLDAETCPVERRALRSIINKRRVA